MAIIGAVAYGQFSNPADYSDSYYEEVIADGPIWYSRFDTDARDEVGSLDGTVTDVSFVDSPLNVPGRGGVGNLQAADFSAASTAKIVVAANAIIQDIWTQAGEYTLEFLLKTPASITTNERLISKTNSPTRNVGWNLYYNGSGFRHRGYAASSGEYHDSPTILINTTYHVVLRYKVQEDKAGMWWINGVEDLAPSVTNGVNWASDTGIDLYFGQESDANNPSDLILSDVAIYDFPLSDARIGVHALATGWV